MKKVIFLLGLTLFFIGCGDNDDTKDPQPEVRMVVSGIEVISSSLPPDLLAKKEEYEYDALGRLSAVKVPTTNADNPFYLYMEKYTYGIDKITVELENSGSYIFSLNDGHIVSQGTPSSFIITYEYDAQNRLVKAVGSDGFHMEYRWEGDNLVEEKYVNPDEIVTYTTTFSPSNVQFLGYFPVRQTLPYYIWNHLYEQGYYGRVSAHLPSRVQRHYNMEPVFDFTIDYTYELDNTGLVISCKENGITPNNEIHIQWQPLQE